MRLLLIALIVVSGVGLAVQPAVNGRMRLAVGSPAAGAAVSFLVSAMIVICVAATGVLGRATPAGALSAPWWAWLGGAFGAVWVTASMVAVARVGAATTFAAVVLGQTAGAVLLDTLGLLGVPPVPLTPLRLLGVALLIAGVACVQWR